MSTTEHPDRRPFWLGLATGAAVVAVCIGYASTLPATGAAIVLLGNIAAKHLEDRQ